MPQVRQASLKRGAVANRLGVSVSMVREWQRAGILPSRVNEAGHHVFEEGDVRVLESKRGSQANKHHSALVVSTMRVRHLSDQDSEAADWERDWEAKRERSHAADLLAQANERTAQLLAVNRQAAASWNEEQRGRRRDERFAGDLHVVLDMLGALPKRKQRQFLVQHPELAELLERLLVGDVRELR